LKDCLNGSYKRALCKNKKRKAGKPASFNTLDPVEHATSVAPEKTREKDAAVKTK
jgi:hypothetical protein